MATRSLGSLSIDLIAKTLGFEQGMDAASRKMQKTLDGMKRQADAFGDSLKSSIANAAAAFGIGFSLDKFVSSIKESINYMDEMGKSAQKVWESVTAFSSLNYAASLAEVGTQDLTDALGKLTKNLATAQNPASEQAKVFKALGIAVKDSSGNMRDSISVFKDFSDKFKALGGDTTAISAGMLEFGRGFQSIIPLVSEGSSAINDAQQEAAALGVVLGKDDAEAAQQFNDDITRLKAATQGWFIQISEALLPVLDAWADDAVDLAKDHEDLGEKTQTLVHILEGLAGIGDLVAGAFKVIGASVQTAAVGIGVFFDDWGQVQNIISHPFSEDAWKTGLRDIAANGQAAAETIKKSWSDASDGISKDMDAALKNVDRIAGNVVDLPKLQTKNAANNIIDSIFGTPEKNKADADKIRGALNGVLSGAGGGHSSGNAAADAQRLSDAYAAMAKEINSLSGAANPDQKAYNDLIEDLREIAKLGGDIIKNGGDVAEAQKMSADAIAAAQAKYQKALQASADAVKEYKDSLNDQLDAQKAVIDVTVKSMQMGDQEAQNYKELADVTAQATKAIADFQRQHALHPEAMTEQAYQEELKATKDYWANVIQYTKDGQQQVANLQGDFTAGMEKGMKDFIEQQNNLFAQGQQFIQNFASGFADAFTQWATGAESAKKAFGDFIDSLFADALRFVANQAVKELFASLGSMGSNSGGSQNVFGYGVGGADNSGGGFWSTVGSFFGSLFGGGHAAGGAANPGMFYRVNENGPELLSVGVSDYLMMGASGGYVHPSSGYGQAANQYINVNVQPTSSRRTADQVAEAVARKQRIASTRNG